MATSTQANATPVLFFSDLDSGPNSGGSNDNGVLVTIWGKNFGPKSQATITVGGGQVASIVSWDLASGNPASWSMDHASFQLGANAATGNIILRNANGTSNGIPFRVRAGRIFFVSPSGTGKGQFAAPISPASIFSDVRAGDTYYFRAGTYAGMYGDTTWGSYNFALGASQSGKRDRPIAFVGYPGESVILQAPRSTYGNITFENGSGYADFYTISNFILRGAGTTVNSGISSRFGTTLGVAGGANIRIVGNTVSANYTGNTMSGMIYTCNSDWTIYGNEFRDTGTTPPIKNNHALYVMCGASDVNIGWNYFHNLRLGHVIQVHTDTAYKFKNIQIHDNVITAAHPDDSRGINIGRALPGTYGSIYNNILYNLGQDFSAVAVYGGDWKIFNNTFYHINASAGMIWLSAQYGGKPTADIVNNILYSNGVSPYLALYGLDESHIKASRNIYYNYRGHRGLRVDREAMSSDPRFRNPQDGDFHLGPGSPAIDQGSLAVTTLVARDHDGLPRPQGTQVDIGAYESPSEPSRSP